TQAMATSGGLEPGLAETLLRETEAALARQEAQGNAPVLLTSPPLRAPLSRFLRHHLPQLGVLSNAEIPDERVVRVTALIGGNGE
ncbi:FHIPEP family type III secretion protein, partial [Bordetella pertussis]